MSVLAPRMHRMSRGIRHMEAPRQQRPDLFKTRRSRGPIFAYSISNREWSTPTLLNKQEELPRMNVRLIRIRPVQEEVTKLHHEAGLPAGFCVWLASPASEPFRGRFLWSNWDVTELL